MSITYAWVVTSGWEISVYENWQSTIGPSSRNGGLTRDFLIASQLADHNHGGDQGISK